jgi:trimeric autotransporter adhesin
MLPTQHRSSRLRVILAAHGAGVLIAALAGPVAGETIYGLANTNPGEGLTSFDSATPGSVAPTIAVFGVADGQSLGAIDFRPGSAVLYAMGMDSVTGDAQVYTLDPMTGLATAIGSGFVFDTESTNFSMDFDPVTGELRLVAADGANVRVDPDTGALAGSDTQLQFAKGDIHGGRPFATGIAYAPNHVGATTTTLFTYDSNNESLATIGGIGGVPSANSGQAFTIGPAGTFAATRLGLDISDRSGIAYVVLYEFNAADTILYRANLATGALTPIAGFGQNSIFDIAVLPSTLFRQGFE